MDLKTARKLIGLSQDKLAELSGVTGGAISYIENGKSMPSVAIKTKLEKGLGCRVNWLDGKGFARFHNQDFSQLEERFRKVLYDLNFLQPEEQADFLTIAKTYLSEMEKRKQC